MKKYILLGSLCASILPISTLAAAGEEGGAIVPCEIGSGFVRHVRELPDENLLLDATGLTLRSCDKAGSPEDDRKTAIDTMYDGFDLKGFFETFDEWTPESKAARIECLKEILSHEGITAADLPAIQEKQKEYRRARSFETGEGYDEKDQEYIDLKNEIIPYWNLGRMLKEKEARKG